MKRIMLLFIVICGGCRAGLEPTEWELKKVGKEIQSREVYDYDSDSYTTYSTDLKGKKDQITSPFLGVFHSIGDERLRFNLGVDLRWNFNSLDDVNKNCFYKELAIPGDNSLVTQIAPSSTSTIPFVGLEIKWSDDFSIGFDVGFPYTKWTARSGRVYTGYFKEDKKDEWRGFGMRYAGTIYFKTDDKEGRIILSAFQESYDPEFLKEKAEILGSGIYIGIERRF